jgi:DNA-binding CsgD family transcriptional regulator
MDFEDDPFSEREKDVIKVLRKGKSNKQIALELGISNRTVEFHLSHIYAKLGVASRSEAIIKLAESQLRESTGGQPVESTVDDSRDPEENGLKSILRRTAMKRLAYMIGGLAVVILLGTFAIFIRSDPNKEPAPPTVNAANPNSPTPAPVNTQMHTEESPTPEGIDPQTDSRIPPHTVNGYTAAIEADYVDTAHILFFVRVTGGEIRFGDEAFYRRIGAFDLYDEQGNGLNASAGMGPAVDPALYQFEFVPATLLTGERIKGQFAFDLNEAPDYEKTLARFRFDFDLPVNPEVRYYPKQTTTANNLEMLLDSVTVTPAFTQVYLCFPPITNAPWTLGNQSALQIDGQEAYPIYLRELFNSETTGDRRAGSEPYWIPPIKNGRCIKGLFPIGSSHPTTLTLTVPRLEKLDGDLLTANQLLLDYPGLSERQAYYTYLEEHGDVYPGVWVFKVQLSP